jgi:hypothetical protein
MKLLHGKHLLPKKPAKRKTPEEHYRELLRKESAIGGSLFGPVPAGRRREFFCLDEHTWVWHEEWIDQSGQLKHMTTRYDVRPQGILKAQGNGHYQLVTVEEAKRLLQAAKLYKQKVLLELYQDQQ